MDTADEMESDRHCLRDILTGDYLYRNLIDEYNQPAILYSVMLPKSFDNQDIIATMLFSSVNSPLPVK